FVIRVRNGLAEWVNVSRGARVGELIEVFGALKEGDTIVRRGTDEIRDGAKITAQAGLHDLPRDQRPAAGVSEPHRQSGVEWMAYASSRGDRRPFRGYLRRQRRVGREG